MQNGLLIATLRLNKNLTQKDIANYLKISLPAYKLYELNLRAMKLEKINMLSNLFNISLNSLLNVSKTLYSHNENQNIDYNYLGFSLTFIRKRNKLSQKDISTMFNISIPTISKYEKKPETVPITYLYQFAKKFNISIDYICGKTLNKEFF